MKQLYLLCGMPFSGKTTLGKTFAEYITASYISLDEINAARGLFGGEGIPVEEWEKTHHLAMKQLKEIAPSQKDIILDDTNCFRWLRDRFRDLAAQYGYQTTLIFLDVPVASIEQRIRANDRTPTRHTVKPEIVAAMQQTFEPPQADENTLVYHPPQAMDIWLEQNFDSKDH